MLYLKSIFTYKGSTEEREGHTRKCVILSVLTLFVLQNVVVTLFDDQTLVTTGISAKHT